VSTGVSNWNILSIASSKPFTFSSSSILETSIIVAIVVEVLGVSILSFVLISISSKISASC